MAMKAKRIRPTKMWAKVSDGMKVVECRQTESFHYWENSAPVMVISIGDYLALKRAAKGKVRK